MNEYRRREIKQAVVFCVIIAAFAILFSMVGCANQKYLMKDCSTLTSQDNSQYFVCKKEYDIQ